MSQKRSGFYSEKALSFLLAVFLLSSPVAAGEVVRIGGTGTGLGTMKLLIAAFEKAHPGIKVKLLSSIGSSGAVRAVAQGALDIGLNGRPLTADELKLGLAVTEYAKTPFIFAAGKNVEVSGLTGDEIVRIYKGELRAWPDGERIRVVLRPASDSDTLIARSILPDMSAAVDAALGREGMLMALTNQECQAMIERTPGSIGFTSLTQIMTETNRLKALSYNGVSPSTASVSEGAYPLVKTLSLVTKRAPSRTVRRFIDFVRSGNGRRILRETGNIPVAGAAGK